METTKTFTYAGRTYTLAKPAAALRAYRAGTMPPDALAHRPWIFRLRNPATGKIERFNLGTHDPKAAIAAAKLRLQARDRRPDEFAAYLATSRQRTFGELADLWLAAHCPGGNGRTRTLDQCADQRHALTYLRPYFGALQPDELTPKIIRDYGAYRRERARKGPGHRSADLEIATASNLCRWARVEGHIKTNPFADLGFRFQDPDDIRHCPADMPATDDELHAIGRAMLNHPDPRHVIAGAAWLYCALTGQRSGETIFLRTDTRPTATGYPPGHRWTTAGAAPREFLAIHRIKGGINPAVHVHPVLADFLAHWFTYRETRGWHHGPWWFPNPHDQRKAFMLPAAERSGKGFSIATALHAATASLGLPYRRPHAQRAYYVRVRRSQGATDDRIAEELGDRTGAPIIVQTYGTADQIRHDARYDWLPDHPGTKPCWQTLHTNILPLAA